MMYKYPVGVCKNLLSSLSMVKPCSQAGLDFVAARPFVQARTER